MKCLWGDLSDKNNPFLLQNAGDEILMHFRSQKKFAAEVSINETIDVDRDGNPLTYLEIIAAPDDIVDSIDRKIKLEKS